MGGFDAQKAYEVTGPERERLQRHLLHRHRQPGDAASLPDDLRERETPSDRKPLDKIAYSGDSLLI